MIKLWAISRKSDGALLPDARRHNSYTEFGDYGSPRLFCTKAGAHTALNNWCRGYWRTGKEWEATDEYGSGFYVQGLPVPIGKGMRNKEEYEVVEIKLERAA